MEPEEKKSLSKNQQKKLAKHQAAKAKKLAKNPNWAKSEPEPQSGPAWKCLCFKDHVYLCENELAKTPPEVVHKVAMGELGLNALSIDHFHCRWCHVVNKCSKLTLMQKVDGIYIIAYHPGKTCDELAAWKPEKK